MNRSGESTININDGIYVLRTTQQNQVQLNLMADQKANIIIGVTMIFFTLVAGRFHLSDAEFGGLGLPLLCLASSLAGSFVLCVMVVTPRVKRGKPCKPEQIGNPLFFGAFSSVQEDEYIAFLLEELRDSDDARSLLIRDIYQTGRVLERKYRFLRWSYLVLAAGVGCAFIAAAWSLM